MEYIPEDPILEFRPDTMEVVRRSYNLHRPGEMSYAVDILEDWVSKQRHFTKRDFSREYLEKCILHAKGSVEKAKDRLDKLCTMRTLVPHAFQVFNIKTDFTEYEDVMEAHFAILPKLTYDHFRVAIIKGTKISRKLVLNCARICFMFEEYLHAHDYSKGNILLIDVMGFNIAEALSVSNVAEIKEMIDLYKGSMDTRIKSAHVLSTSKVVEMAVNLFKQFVGPKLASRLYVHATYDTVYHYIHKEILPIEYGGQERPLVEMKNLWVELLSSKEVMNYFKTIRKARTDENKRSQDRFNDLYMGISGTFRNLIVD